MKQLTRRLTLKMKLAGGNPGILAGTEASITGIAPALDIAALKLQGDPATVRPVFVREGDVLTAELNLLGTAADVRQEFIIVLIATDGQRQTLARDMTGALSDFNRGTAPMMLDATLELMNDALPGCCSVLAVTTMSRQTTPTAWRQYSPPIWTDACRHVWRTTSGRRTMPSVSSR